MKGKGKGGGRKKGRRKRRTERQGEEVEPQLVKPFQKMVAQTGTQNYEAVESL